jgi:hypothetical protein
MIVAASTTLLAESQSGRRGGVPPWALLVAGSVASLVAKCRGGRASPDRATDRRVASFALTASYELLTREVRRGAAGEDGRDESPRRPPSAADPVEACRHRRYGRERVAWVPQIQHGVVTSLEVIARYVEALNGRRPRGDFGDQTVRLVVSDPATRRRTQPP